MCGLGTVTRLRYYLFHITLGRVLASFVYPEHHFEGIRDAETEQWIKELGHRQIELFGKPTGAEHQDACHCKSVEIREANYVRLRQREEPDTNIWL